MRMTRPPRFAARRPGHRRRRVHRLVPTSATSWPARRDADHGPRQADLRRQPRRTSPRSRPIRSRPPASRSSRGDIADPAVVGPLVAAADAVVNFAAESHVDRSHPRSRGVPARPGSSASMSCSRRSPRRDRTPPAAPSATSRSRPTRSTAPSPRASRARTTPLAPRSPYAAAKAAGELLVRSYVVTHGVDAVVTRGSNTYGPYHHPEKLIPLFVTNAIDDQPAADVRRRPPAARLAVRRRPRRRRSTHVLRHGDARRDLQRRRARRRWTNREVVAALLERLGKPWSLVRTVDGPARPRPALRDGRRRSWRRSAGATGPRSRTAWRRPSTGSAPTRPGGGRPRSGDWDAYYERQYGRAWRARRPAVARTA